MKVHIRITVQQIMFDFVFKKIKESQIFNPAKRALQPIILIFASAQNKINTFKNSLMPTPTFYEDYASRSLAILNHSSNVEQASQKAQEYRLPLLQIRIGSKKEEEIIDKYFLSCFATAQFLNQNLVVFAERIERLNIQQNPNEIYRVKKGFLIFYKQQQAYGKFLISELPQSEEEIYKIIQNKRNEFFQIDLQKKNQSQSNEQQEEQSEKQENMEQEGDRFDKFQVYREPREEQRPLPSVSQFFQP